MRGSALPAAVGVLAPDLLTLRGEPRRPAAGDLLRLGRRAMGCRFEVILPADGPSPVGEMVL